MDIRQPSWKYRYDGLAKQYGLDINTFMFKLHPMVELFCMQEVYLFDESLGDLQTKCPKLEKRIQDYRARIADPFISCVIFNAYNIPLFEKRIELAKAYLSLLKEKVKTLLNDHPEAEGFDEIIKPEETYFRNLEKLLEQAKEKLPQYEQFVFKLTDKIVERDSKSIIIAPNYSPVQREQIRNEIYRTVLNEESSWLLGWDIILLNRSLTLEADKFERLKKMYDETPEIQKVSSNVQMKVIFPLPLGEDKVSGKLVYEKIIPNEPSSEEQTNLETTVQEHFRKRVNAIFS